LGAPADGSLGGNGEPGDETENRGIGESEREVWAPDSETPRLLGFVDLHRVFANKLAHAINGFLGFRQYGSKHLPDVNHFRPDF